LNCDGFLRATGNAWCNAEVYLYGSGGGTSHLFAQPWYQQGVVPTALATRWSSTPHRVVPDIAAVGDPNTGMLVGQTQTFTNGTTSYDEFRLGGTSLSSPLMAGMFAVAQQIRGLNNPIGFANPLLYKGGMSAAAFNDIQHVAAAPPGILRADYANSENATNGILYSVRTLDFHTSSKVVQSPAFPTGDYDASIFTRSGYDDVTGLGTPTGSFYAALAAAH
jgi:subtilase family serine protease